MFHNKLRRFRFYFLKEDIQWKYNTKENIIFHRNKFPLENKINI